MPRSDLLRNDPIVQNRGRFYLGFDDFAAAQAGSADADAPGCPGHLGPDRPQIDIPAPLGHIVGVADVVAELRPLAANITYLCHGTALQKVSEPVVEALILQDQGGIRQMPRISL